MRRPRLADIAARSGLSVATVSRALRGCEGVNTATQAQVRGLAHAMGYAPNVAAQRLRLGQATTVALVVPDQATEGAMAPDRFIPALSGRVVEALAARQHETLLLRLPIERLDTVAELFDSSRVIGTVVLGPETWADAIEALARHGVPLAAWGTRRPGQRAATVGIDHAQSGALATAHLLAAGRRRIAFVGDPALRDLALRHLGYRRAHAAVGRRPDPALTLAVAPGFEPAQAALQRLLARGPAPDGLVAASDEAALAAIGVLQDHDLAVPDDVAVVGHGDIDAAGWSRPALSSVRLPAEDTAAALVGQLLARVAGRQARPLTLPVQLVARASSAQAPAVQAWAGTRAATASPPYRAPPGAPL